MTKAERRAAAAAARAARAGASADGPDADDGAEGADGAEGPEASPDHCPECGLRLVPATRRCPIDPDAHTPERPEE